VGSQHCPYTDQIVMYIIGESTPEESDFFAKHIASCPACREEAEQLQQTWQMIPLQLEEVEPPADLKAEVMEAIFPPSASSAPETVRMRLKRFLEQLRYPSHRWITAVLLLALGGSLWNNWLLREQLQAIEAQTGVPTQVLQEYTLKAADSAMGSAKGSAWLFQQGSRKKLVFHLQGLAATQGEQAYQIWLIHDGQRRSAGVFHVDQQGNGVLTYEFSDQAAPFEAIGITLEPDAQGNKPRGKKVLGT
jgi:anti-sigma-K factor RskA